MRVLRKTIKAWLIGVPALILLFFVLFPPSSRHEFEETIGFMLIYVVFLGVPLFVVILLFNAIFNRSPAAANGNPLASSRSSQSKNAWILAVIGFVLAGAASFFIEGIIWEVWLILAFIGGLLGFIAGMVGR